MKPIFFAAVISFIFFSVSCSTSKPEITYGFIQLVLYQGEKGPVEQYSFFVIPEDEDGFENLDELYLYHDKDQLRWHIKSDDWISYAQDGRTWIGSRSIVVQDGFKLPRGVFRAVLVNKGGERGEREFTFDAEVRYRFPEFEVNDGSYTIKSEWPSNHLVCYDRAGNYTSTVEVSSFSGSISQLNLPTAVRSAALWAEDPVHFTSAFTNVVPVR
jgi:hypothetical protein